MNGRTYRPFSLLSLSLEGAPVADRELLHASRGLRAETTHGLLHSASLHPELDAGDALLGVLLHSSRSDRRSSEHRRDDLPQSGNAQFRHTQLYGSRVVPHRLGLVSDHGLRISARFATPVRLRALLHQGEIDRFLSLCR